MSQFLDVVSSYQGELLQRTGEHLGLVAVAIGIAALIGIPAGVWLTRQESAQRWVLGAANTLQTIPSLALFGFLIPIPLLGGIGPRPAIIALVAYALLPIVRNTFTGISEVDPAVRQAAVAMGLTDGQLLRLVELPLAARTILAGLRVATVNAIGLATIAALIGAGGLGAFIFLGIQTVNTNLLLLGAVPAAVLALLADFALGLLEKRITRNR